MTTQSAQQDEGMLLITDARSRLQRNGWVMQEKVIGDGWQVVGDNGKIMLLVYSATLAGAWVGLLAEVTDLALLPFDVTS